MALRGLSRPKAIFTWPFYSEALSLPAEARLTRGVGGRLEQEFVNPEERITRQIEVELVFPPTVAEAFVQWLNDRLEDRKRLLAEAGEQNAS